MNYTNLRQQGLLNIDSGDLRDLMSDEEDTVRVTYCSSNKCDPEATSRKGRAICVGGYLKSCPHCSTSNYLFFEEVTERYARYKLNL